MRIEGMKSVERESPDHSRVIEFVPDGRGRSRYISLAVGPEGDRAVIRLMEGREPPGIDQGETVTVAGYSEEIGNRVVRALASLHLGVDDAATGNTAADAALIARGFVLGVIGTEEGRHPAWLSSGETSVLAVTKTPSGGLPSLATDPVFVALATGDGRRVVVHAHNLEDAFAFIDSGRLPNMLPEKGTIEVAGGLVKRGTTYH